MRNLLWVWSSRFHQDRRTWLLLHQTKADRPKLVSKREFKLNTTNSRGRRFETHSVWHHQQVLSFLRRAGLHLAHHHRSHVLVFIDDWHDERSVRFAIERWQVIDERNKSWTVVPRTCWVVDCVLDSLSGYSRHRHEGQIFCFEAATRERERETCWRAEAEACKWSSYPSFLRYGRILSLHSL